MLGLKSKVLLASLAVAGLLLVAKDRLDSSTLAESRAAALSTSNANAALANAVDKHERPGAAIEPLKAKSRNADFEGASDLYGYLLSLRERELAADPEALWMASRVLDYCGAFAANPAGYAVDTQEISKLAAPAAVAMAVARNRIARRCARFTPADAFSLASLRDKRLDAARAGSLAAEAALLAMGEPLSESDGYQQDLIQRVRQSGDPEAYLALSPAMGLAASGQEAFFGDVSGTQYSELAWQLAACRLGTDCSAGGALMTAYCANGGICSRDGSQDFYTFVLDAAVPRQGADNLNGMVNSLMADIGGSE